MPWFLPTVHVDWKCVELRGFEPLTSSVQRRRSPGLSYSPTREGFGIRFVGDRALTTTSRCREDLIPKTLCLYNESTLTNWIVERTSP